MSAPTSVRGSLTPAVGATLKDGFRVVHGAGDEIRGNINSAFDGLGDALAGRPAGVSSGDAVAARGAAEAETGRQGIEVREEAHEARKDATANPTVPRV